MSKKGQVKMGLGDFLGTSAAAAAQPVRGVVLPSGPDPDRDPNERRGPGGRRYDDDYDGPGVRSEGADNWRRGSAGGGGFGGGGFGDERRRAYDQQGGGVAPDDGTWRSRAPPTRGSGGGFDDRRGGAFDRREIGGRDGGYNDPLSSAGERPRLQLQSRTIPLPPPPPSAEKEAPVPGPAPRPKPSGPRANPFGAAQAVDTTQRDREIEAKAEAARQAALRRRDESVRSSVPPAPVIGAQAADDGAEVTIANDAAKGDTTDAADSVEEAAVDDSAEDEEASAAQQTAAGETADAEAAEAIEAADGAAQVKADVAVAAENMRSTPEDSSKPVGRWAALRRENADDRTVPSTGAFPRRDREDDRRAGGVSGAFDGRRDERSAFGRRDDGGSGTGGFGSRMDRDNTQPPAPPAGNAFAKRFGSNFDRDSDRMFPRSGGMGGGGSFDRRDDERRGGMGMGASSTFDRRSDDRRGGMGMGGGAFERRDDDRRSIGSGYGGAMGVGSGIDRRDDDRRNGGGAVEGRDDSRAGAINMGSGVSGRFGRVDEQPAARPSAAALESRFSPPPGARKTTSDTPIASMQRMSIKGTGKDEPAAMPASDAVSKAPADGQHDPEIKPEPAPIAEPEAAQELKEDPEEAARASAKEALESGKRGKELKEFVMCQEKRTTAGALLRGVLDGNPTPQDLKWAAPEEFGEALTALAGSSTKEQVGMIYAVQAACHALGFPKDPSAGGAVVQVIFMHMYQNDLCEEEAFIEWKDDVDNPEPGRMTAVMQTTPWFVWLESVDEEEDDEED